MALRRQSERELKERLRKIRGQARPKTWVEILHKRKKRAERHEARMRLEARQHKFKVETKETTLKGSVKAD